LRALALLKNKHVEMPEWKHDIVSGVKVEAAQK